MSSAYILSHGGPSLTPSLSTSNTMLMQPHSNSKTVRYTCSTSHSYLDIPIHFYNQFINTKWRSVCFSLYLWTFPLPVSASYSLFFPRSSLRVTATSFYGSFHTRTPLISLKISASTLSLQSSDICSSSNLHIKLNNKPTSTSPRILHAATGSFA